MGIKYTIKGDITYIHITRKNGDKYDVLIDTEDLSRLVNFSLCVSLQRGRIYIFIGDIYLHRFILTAPKNKLVDHRDGNGLNNRKYNLRLTTKSGNAQNILAHKDSTTKTLGVYWAKNSNKYQVQFTLEGVKHHLGYYTCIEEAKKVALEFRKTNMPFSKEANSD